MTLGSTYKLHLDPLGKTVLYWVSTIVTNPSAGPLGTPSELCVNFITVVGDFGYVSHGVHF